MYELEFILPTETNSYTCVKVTLLKGGEVNASIPKYVKAPQTDNYGITIDLTPNAVTGDVNETGIKRVRALLKALDGNYTQPAQRAINCVDEAAFREFHNI